jgi:ribosomal protein S18 acetylase RimI-like enzyme
MELSFVRCTHDDLDSLTELSRSTFIAAFEKVNDPADFSEYMDTAFSREKIRSELLNPNSEFYFGYYNNELVGYFKLNANDAQNEQFEASSIELERIYVLEGFQGKQLGKQMLLKTIAVSKVKQVSFLWLGVWNKNTSAVRFYERYGFIKFGSHPYYIGDDKQTDWLMKLNLI